MKIKSLVDEQPKLMIIPMIDIIFFLLVFFMLSMMSMVHQKSLPVNLPVAGSAVVNTVKRVPVSITDKGELYYEKEAVSLDTLIARLKAQKASDNDVAVILLGDAGVNYEKVVAVMDAIKQAGIVRVSIATDLR